MSDFIQTDQRIIDARNRLMRAIEDLFTARYDQLLGTSKDLSKLHAAEHCLTVAIIDVEETSKEIGYEGGFEFRDSYDHGIK
jgi:hypothetical protein